MKRIDTTMLVHPATNCQNIFTVIPFICVSKTDCSTGILLLMVFRCVGPDTVRDLRQRFVYSNSVLSIARRAFVDT